MRKILKPITMLWNGFVGSFVTTKENSLHGLGLKETTRIESKKLSPMTRDEREKSTGFPLGIFKQTTGSQSITSTTIAPQQSLIMMVLVTLTTLLLVTTALLLVAFTMLIPYSKIGTILLLAAIAISVVCILRTALTLRVLLVWWRVASKGQKKRGQDRAIMIGGKVL